ncbi:hypothetical protein ACNQR7_30660 [Mycolicibacterium senegalense]|uniref:hypothetical protein n=1 Tax=Mycolicibacterium senegalense TaxID=1796 RepID=UPI003AAA81A1
MIARLISGVLSMLNGRGSFPLRLLTAVGLGVALGLLLRLVALLLPIVAAAAVGALIYVRWVRPLRNRSAQRVHAERVLANDVSASLTDESLEQTLALWKRRYDRDSNGQSHD